MPDAQKNGEATEDLRWKADRYEWLLNNDPSAAWQLERENVLLRDALNALTIWSPNGEQLCFRHPGSTPMGMSKRQERLAREALGV